MRFFTIISMMAMLLLSSCAHQEIKFLPAPQPEDIVNTYRGSVLKLASRISICSAFYIGDDLVVSARHCIGQKPEEEINYYTLVDVYDNHYTPQLVSYDDRRDLLLLRVNHISSPKLEIWNIDKDGELPEAAQLITIGFPGYFMNFTFEVGYYKGFFKNKENTRMLISKNISSPGYSGGPIINVKTGKLVGIQHAMANRTVKVGANLVQDNWIDYAVDASELLSWLKELKITLD